MNTLRESYNLQPDNSGLGTGLIIWYNNVINKTYDELDVADISKMYRQGLIVDVAVDKAIELIFLNPYDGEYKDGGLLELITTFDLSKVKSGRLLELKELLDKLTIEYISFEWCSEEDMNSFKTSIDTLIGRIAIK